MSHPEFETACAAGASQHRRLLHEVVLDRIAGGCAAGIDPQLIEDGSHMRVDGRQAHHQSFGNLSIGQSFGQ